MTIDDAQRDALTKALAKAFAKATGTKRTEHGIDQWEPLVDALLKTIEGIVKTEIGAQHAEQDTEAG